VEAGLAALRRSFAGNLAGWGLSDGARYEIDFRLRQKERDYEDAVLAAHNLTFDVLADDGLVAGGQAVRLSLFFCGESRGDGGGRDAGGDRRGSIRPARASRLQ